MEWVLEDRDPEAVVGRTRIVTIAFLLYDHMTALDAVQAAT